MQATAVRMLLQDEEKLVAAYTALLKLRKICSKAKEEEGEEEVGAEGSVRFASARQMEIEALDAEFEEVLQKYLAKSFELAQRSPRVLKQLISVVTTEDRLRDESIIDIFCASLMRSIKRSVQTAIDQEGQPVSASLDILNRLFDSLIVVQQTDVYFPLEKPIFPSYFSTLLSETRRFVIAVAERKTLTTADILNLHHWARVTYTEKLALHSLDLQRWPITDVLGPTVDTYVRKSIPLMEEWIGRLIEREVSSPFHVHTKEGFLMTESVVTLFKFVNQQLDLLLVTGDSHFISEVSRETARLMMRFQQAQADRINDLYTQLPFEYLLATVNNSDKALEYLAQHKERLSGLLKCDVQHFSDLTAAFEDARSLSIRAIVAHLFHLFREADDVLGKCFTKAWSRPAANTARPLEIVSATLSDALNVRIGRFLPGQWAVEVALETLRQLLIRYVAELCAKSGYGAATATLIERDRALVLEVFAPLLQSHVFLLNCQQLFDSLAIFLRTPLKEKDAIVEAYVALGQSFPDISTQVLKHILSLRKDAKRTQIEEIAKMCAAFTRPRTSRRFFAALVLKEK
jgi:hypothetical protein